jgi:hypothetical protein
MCQTRFLKWGQPRSTFLKSSVWHGIKQHVTTVKGNSRLLIGSGNNIVFWLDNWLDAPLAELFNFPMPFYHFIQCKGFIVY